MTTSLELKQEEAAQAQPKAIPEYPGTYYLFKDIDDGEAERFCAALWAMANTMTKDQGQHITVFINSGGGSIGAGFAMIEMMYKIKRELGIPIHTIILGYAYSMAAVIFQAGDRRSMGYFSTTMLHTAQWEVKGPERAVFIDLKKLADLYRNMEGELFYRRTGLHSPQWWRRFINSGQDRYLSAQECLKLRLVDEVCEFLDECYILPPLPPQETVEGKKSWGGG